MSVPYCTHPGMKSHKNIKMYQSLISHILIWNHTIIYSKDISPSLISWYESQVIYSKIISPLLQIFWYNILKMYQADCLVSVYFNLFSCSVDLSTRLCCKILKHFWDIGIYCFYIKWDQSQVYRYLNNFYFFYEIYKFLL